MDFILRPWLESDAKDLTIHLNNKKIWDNCRDGLPFPYTETAADAFIKYASEQVEQNEFCIEVNHEAVGNIGFVRVLRCTNTTPHQCACWRKPDFRKQEYIVRHVSKMGSSLMHIIMNY